MDKYQDNWMFNWHEIVVILIYHSILYLNILFWLALHVIKFLRFRSLTSITLYFNIVFREQQLGWSTGSVYKSDRIYGWRQEKHPARIASVQFTEKLLLAMVLPRMSTDYIMTSYHGTNGEFSILNFWRLVVTLIVWLMLKNLNKKTLI